MNINLYNNTTIIVHVQREIVTDFLECTPSVILLHRAKFSNRLRKLEFRKNDIEISSDDSFYNYQIVINSELHREQWFGYWTLLFSFEIGNNSPLTVEFPSSLFYKHPIITECCSMSTDPVELYIVRNEDGSYSAADPLNAGQESSAGSSSDNEDDV